MTPEPDGALDRVVHEPARLAILTNLYVVENADATWLLQQTGLTWGNLASHLAKLEKAEYVTVDKGFRGRKPRTRIALTDAGRTALRVYRSRMMQALEGVDPAE